MIKYKATLKSIVFLKKVKKLLYYCLPVREKYIITANKGGLMLGKSKNFSCLFAQIQKNRLKFVTVLPKKPEIS
jgi:hypothetical protein